MLNFLSTLSPNYIPRQYSQSDDFALIRERILQLIMLGAAIVGAFFYLSNIFLAISERAYALIIVYSLIYIWVLATTIIRRIPFRLRATSLLAILFAVALLGLLQYGLSGNGRMFLIAFSVLATTLLGLGAGSLTTFIGIVTLIFTAVLKTNTNPLMSPVIISQAEQGSNWISAIFAFILVNVIMTGSLQIIVLRI
jgi:hypothetical protein